MFADATALAMPTEPSNEIKIQVIDVWNPMSIGNGDSQIPLGMTGARFLLSLDMAIVGSSHSQ